MTNRRNVGVALVAALLTVLYFVPQVAVAQANATGTWKWEQQGFGGGRGRGAGGGGGAPGAGAPASQPAGGAQAGAPGGGAGRGGGRGGAPIPLTLNLKQDGDKVTGQLLGMSFGGQESMPLDVKEGTIKDGTISFKIIQDFNGNAITTAYTGKLEGDKITGTREVQFPGGGGGRGPGGAPGAGAPATPPGGGARAGGGAPGGAGGAGRGGGRGFGGPQEWIATRQK